jgi:hypothetical protein
MSALATTTPLAAASTTRLGPLARLGGLALGAAPVLLALGMVTTPPQDSDSSADYVASLAADRVLTAVSADFYHYAFVCFAFGLLAVVALVPGRRGRTLTTVLAVLGAVTSVQMSGLLMTDFYLSSIAHHADVATGAAVLDDLGASVAVWLATGQVAALMLVLVPLGLARAGVLRWPVALLPVLSLALFVVPLPAPGLLVAQVALFAPYLLAAQRLVRGRA